MADLAADLLRIAATMDDAARIRAAFDCGIPVSREAVTLRQAAAALSLPRALVEWTAPTGDTVEAHLRGVGMIWRGSVTSAPDHAERWRAAGLDVGEVPRG